MDYGDHLQARVQKHAQILLCNFYDYLNPAQSNSKNSQSPQNSKNEDLPSANGKVAIFKLDGKKWILENLGETTKEINIKAEQVFQNINDRSNCQSIRYIICDLLNNRYF